MILSELTFLNYFIPSRIQADAGQHQQARLLIALILSLIMISVILGLSLMLSGDEVAYPVYKIVLGGAFLLFSFKAYGQFNLTANLMAAVLAFILVPQIPASGGLYSDHLLWMVFCPIVVAIFGSGRLYLLWFCAVAVLFIREYRLAYLNQARALDAIATHGPTYYAISFGSFLLLISIVVLLFKRVQMQALQNLHANQKTLEAKYHELSIINKQLSDATGALTRSNQELEAFAAVASHDLKEPLRMISMYSQLLSKSIGGQAIPEQSEYMQNIQEGVEHMHRMLDDILDYSSIGRSQERIRLIDLDDVVYYVRRLMAATIQESGTQIVITNDLPQVYGRYSELVQVVQNILSNAIKFRKKDVPAHVTISYQSDKRGHLITFEDNGIGIELQYLQRVFKMFERLHTRSEYAGSGIGLALCNKIVTNLGGEIWIESEIGVGTRILIRFPLEFVPEDAFVSA